MIEQGIQKTINKIGDYGCGILCLMHHFGYTQEDIIRLYSELVARDIIDTDCYIKSWVNILEYLDKDKNKWKAEISKELKTCTFYLEYWYNPATKLHHFTLPTWDSYGTSQTRLNGYIESYRLFYKQ